MSKYPKCWGVAAISLGSVFGAASVRAQQPVKNLPRIGYLSASSLAAIASRTEAFRDGLKDLGYVDGKNISIEYRYGDGKLDRVPALATELMRLKVAMIVIAGGNATVEGAKRAIDSVPIIMANVQDPVGSGFVASLARPGGNITGLSTLTAELVGKRLDLIRETFPEILRVAALSTVSYTHLTLPTIYSV